jgi:hypothetical protein
MVVGAVATFGEVPPHAARARATPSAAVAASAPRPTRFGLTALATD